MKRNFPHRKLFSKHWLVFIVRLRAKAKHHANSSRSRFNLLLEPAFHVSMDILIIIESTSALVIEYSSSVDSKRRAMKWKYLSRKYLLNRPLGALWRGFIPIKASKLKFHSTKFKDNKRWEELKIHQFNCYCWLPTARRLFDQNMQITIMKIIFGTCCAPTELTRILIRAKFRSNERSILPHLNVPTIVVVSGHSQWPRCDIWSLFGEALLIG